MNETLVGIESIDHQKNHHVTNTEQNPAMSDSSNLNITAATALLDESDKLNLLADAFLASSEYSQLHSADTSLQPQLRQASSSNPYLPINPYDDFSWILLASQPLAETSEQRKTYAPGLILPQPLPQTYTSPPPFACAPTPSALMLKSTLSQLDLAAEPVSNPPSLTDYLQDLTMRQPLQSPAPTDQQVPSCLPQVSMNAPPETSETMALLQSSQGVAPSQIPAQSSPTAPAQSSPPPSTINSTGPSIVSIPVQSSPVVPPQVSTDAPETSQIMALPQSLPGVPPSQIPVQTSPAAPALSSPPLSTMNSTSPSTVSLMPSPVDQFVDLPDASLSVPPPHTSKRRRHHDSNESEIADALVASRSKRVRIGSKRNDIANSIGQDNTKSATQR